jgi:hypothetical protein
MGQQNQKEERIQATDLVTYQEDAVVSRTVLDKERDQ